jgi:hypothetical protein
MKNLDKANEWLQREKSNMARAKSGRHDEAVNGAGR